MANFFNPEKSYKELRTFGETLDTRLQSLEKPEEPRTLPFKSPKMFEDIKFFELLKVGKLYVAQIRDDITKGLLGFLTDAQKTDLTDGGATTLHTHAISVVEDTTPQLLGDLDLNGHNLDFPTTANISDCLDEDTMNSDSATKLATQQSIKAYTDTSVAGIRSTMEFIATGTWVCPLGVTTIYVDIVGGGGGGGGAFASDSSSGAGGGGAGGLINHEVAVTPLTSYSIVIGAAGAAGSGEGGTNGGNGTNSTAFGHTAPAGGGGMGSGSAGINPATAGTAGDATAGAGGTSRVTEGNGYDGAVGTGGGSGGIGGIGVGGPGGGGGGASGISGDGGHGGAYQDNSGITIGLAGAGGGGASQTTSGGKTGKAGGAGIVIIKIPN